MAGTTASSIVSITAYNSSTPKGVQWVSLATEAGRHIDVNGVDSTKMILLVTADSTDQANDVIYIGCTDTDDSDTADYSAGKLNQMKVNCARVTKGTAYAKLRSTASTHLKSLYAIGPFETARFKDSDGYINIAKGKEGSSVTFICPILLP
jgi:hypothetical protein